jgi:hypothetical protein
MKESPNTCAGEDKSRCSFRASFLLPVPVKDPGSQRRPSWKKTRGVARKVQPCMRCQIITRHLERNSETLVIVAVARFVLQPSS